MEKFIPSTQAFHRSASRFFIITLASVAVAEAAIMTLFLYIHLSQFAELFVDTFLLACLVSPLLYLFKGVQDLPVQDLQDLP